MSEPSWIGLGGLAASVLSALAAYLAIRQTIIQRRISIKPQLIINNLEINENQLSTNNYTSAPFDKVSRNKLSPTVVNAGAGAALNVLFQWSFPYKKKLHWMSSNLATINNHFSINHSIIDFRNKPALKVEGGLSTVIYQEERNEIMNYILPLNIDKNHTIVKMPPLILNTIINIANFKALLNDPNINPIDGPTLRIEYQDVEGNKFNINYISRFVVHEIVPGLYTNRYIGTLEFIVVKKGWTAQTLQRIRKSYADFMNEYDFNINKHL